MSFYVDELLEPVPDEETASKLVKGIRHMCSKVDSDSPNLSATT